MRNLAYFLSLIPGCLAITGNLLGGDWAWLNFCFSLVFLPVFEWISPEIRSNRNSAASVIPDIVLVLHFFMQAAVLWTFADAVVHAEFFEWQVVGALLSVGVHSGSSSIVVAHEMIHRKSPLWQWAGRILLWSAGNIYFYVEHLRVHHKWVGTDRDPATARKGESLYSFFGRSSFGQIKGAWQLEKERLLRSGKSVLSPSNEIVRSLLAVITVSFILQQTGGLMLTGLFLIQCFIANFLLEFTNYIEHYGLTRSESERVVEGHSWQTDKAVSRFILIDLSRHADHHYLASKPYHTLDSHPQGAVLPFGYTSAVYLALIPPLWFRLVDPLVEAVKLKNR